MVLYYGVYASQPANAVVSPNGDGVAEGQRLAYKVVRPSTVEARLIGPGNKVVWKWDGEREPGRFPLEPACEGARRGQLAVRRQRRRRRRQPLADHAALHRQRDARIPQAFGRQPEVTKKRSDTLRVTFRTAHTARVRVTVENGARRRRQDAPQPERPVARRGRGRPGTAVTGGAGSSPRAAYIVRVRATNSSAPCSWPTACRSSAARQRPITVF